MSKAAKKRPPRSGSITKLEALRDLEMPIRDVERAAKVAYLMMMHEVGDKPHEGDGLTTFAIEQCERLAGELCEQFYAALDEGKAV